MREKYQKELDQLEAYELVHEVLYLQKELEDLRVSENKASSVHNYHFTSAELLKLSTKRYYGSGVIISLHGLDGKRLIAPTTIRDGLSVASINGLLDDIQLSYDRTIELKPVTTRLSKEG